MHEELRELNVKADICMSEFREKLNQMVDSFQMFHSVMTRIEDIIMNEYVKTFPKKEENTVEF
jgi:hypothetical protein